MKIPLTKPYWGPAESRLTALALQRSSGVGDGPYTKRCITLIKRLTGSRFVIPTTSCTHGMELVMHAMVTLGKLKPGDEVIVPSFTMSSTANAVLLAGGIPVFADIDPVYANIEPRSIESKLTPRTRGIMVVHYAGMPVPIRKIQKIARINNLFLVEDAAHAIGSFYEGKMLGTFGDAGVYSFHGTKNISCGEGGAVVTDDKKLASVMEIFRANGTNRRAFLDGVIDKYSWVGKGSSYYLSDILAAILVAQLSQCNTIIRKRTRIAHFYTKAFQSYSAIASLPIVPENSLPNWHIYALRFNSDKKATLFYTLMRKKGIEVSYHYVPLHRAPMGIEISGGNPTPLPITENISRTLIRLPIFAGMTYGEQKFVTETAVSIFKKLSI